MLLSKIDEEAADVPSDAREFLADGARRFGGVARLYGEAAMTTFRGAHVVVVGIGGVGSWAAEALARSAIGRITLVDLDHIAESNVNRQLHALDTTLGQAKVVAMAERIAGINPFCSVTAIDEFASTDNALQLVTGADAVVDCADEVRGKVALIAAARDVDVAIITCGAAGGRLDPTRVRCADLGLVVGDPLLAKVRYRLRREHGFPPASAAKRPFGVIGVYSDEAIRGLEGAGPVRGAGLACAGYGSSVAVTATMGFVAAAQTLARLAHRDPAAARRD